MLVDMYYLISRLIKTNDRISFRKIIKLLIFRTIYRDWILWVPEFGGYFVNRSFLCLRIGSTLIPTKLKESNFQNLRLIGIFVFPPVYQMWNFPNIKGPVIFCVWWTRAKHHKNVMDQFFKLRSRGSFSCKKKAR